MNNTFPQTENPSGYAPIGKLLPKFAIPAAISMLVNAMYNIVDQIFIGQGVGMLGNAATNVAFPLTTVCVSIALLLGIGGAANFNLEQGRKHPENATRIAGTAFGALMIFGVLFAVIVHLFLEPLLHLCGATEAVFPYALTYVRITSLGFPAFILITGGPHLIRADGSPTYSMISMVTGAIINTILDPLFIFVFHWGIAGAAWATVIGQICSAILVLRYLPRYKTIRLTKKHLVPDKKWMIAIVSLGMAACFNQLAMTVAQIVMNNVLRHYGASSIYGSDIPLAVVGIISKINAVFISIAVGISQGAQPLIGFNFGAKQYDRVKKTYITAASTAFAFAALMFVIFQLFPQQIIRIFGEGDALYYQFGENYLKIFMFCIFLNGFQPITSNFFTSIGKATKGILISMTRQLIFLVPLVVIFPRFMGIDGIMYAGPISDTATAALALTLVYREMKRLPAR